MQAHSNSQVNTISHTHTPPGITRDGEKEEYVNESYSYNELELFVPILKLVERQGNQGEKLLNAEISNLIGRRLHDFDVMGAEVSPTHNYACGFTSATCQYRPMTYINFVELR